MRRHTKLICLLLFIALGASGWESVLAAARCQHVASDTQKSDAMPADHACCHARLKHAEQHCETASGRSEMSGMKMPDAAEPSSEAQSDAVETATMNSALPAIAACEHCFNQSTPAPPGTRKQNQNSRTADALPEIARVFVTRQPFALPVMKRQGAPPGTQIRRHILNSIFLI